MSDQKREVQVRPVHAQDRSQWIELWHGFLKYYEKDVIKEKTHLLWNKLLDPYYSTRCIVATQDDLLIGFAHYYIHNSTWADFGYCYMEDLFVAPDARSLGAGKKLIEALSNISQSNKCTKLYWHTNEDNTAARHLYDQVSTLKRTVYYEIKTDEKRD